MKNFGVKKLKTVLLFVAILSNLVLFIFMGFYHNRGSLPIMDSLRENIILDNKIN